MELTALPLGAACGVAVQVALCALPLARPCCSGVGLYVRAPGAGARRFATVFGSSWPFFSRIAIIWATGFGYWNALPIIGFWRYGAVYAGELGFALALLRVGMQFAESLLSSQRGRLSAAWAAEPHHAWELFSQRCRMAHVVLVLGYGLFFVVLPFVPDWLRLRLLPGADLALFAVGYVAMLFPLHAALLLRCSGREVFFAYSLSMNLITPVLLLIIAMLGSPLYLAVGFALLHLIFLPRAGSILAHHRTAMRGEPS
jgi:hypothetical protein